MRLKPPRHRLTHNHRDNPTTHAVSTRAAVQRIVLGLPSIRPDALAVEWPALDLRKARLAQLTRRQSGHKRIRPFAELTTDHSCVSVAAQFRPETVEYKLDVLGSLNGIPTARGRQVVSRSGAAGFWTWI
jgi:hypothetical protein